MKGMPLPFDFEGKGVLDLELLVKSGQTLVSSDFAKQICFGEPTSVLDSARISRRPTTSSTLSSSLGGSGGGSGAAASADTAGVAAVTWQQESAATATSSIAGGADSELLRVPQSLEIRTSGAAGTAENLPMEHWESVLSESVAVSPAQEQSILRLMMGDLEDSDMASLNKVLQIGAGSAASELDFGCGFGAAALDQGFGANFMSTVPNLPSSNRSSVEKIGLISNQISSNLPTNFKFPPNSLNIVHPSNIIGAENSFDSSAEMKSPIFNSQLLVNHHAQNPSFFFPLSFPQQQEQNNLFLPPQTKRHNPGGGHEPGSQILKGSFEDTGQFMGRQQPLRLLHQQQLPHQLHYLQQGPVSFGRRLKTVDGDELGHSHQPQQQQEQAIVDQLYKVAELVQTGNPVLAQGILARLNHQLSPIGKPFNRAAFYCKEALQLLLHTNDNTSNFPNSPPVSLIYQIGAYKSFSEISPLIQFANFTCNQAILEALEGFDRIHIVDFDIGYGGQWASLMQELALRSGGSASLKITALTSPSHDQLELGLTRENLIQFASEINIDFQFEAKSMDSFISVSWSLPFHSSENEAVAVNLPVCSLANYQLSVPLVLSFVKQLSPRIVVSVDRGCDRTDLPFASHIIHALQSYTNLLGSLDACNVNMDALQKIERLLLQPGIEKIVLSRFRSPEKTQHWRTLFLSSGLSPVTFSNFSETQGECVVKRMPTRGFEVEKRQSSLVLCWQRKELISASAWRY